MLSENLISVMQFVSLSRFPRIMLENANKPLHYSPLVLNTV